MNKKTLQALAISAILSLTFFAGTAAAQACNALNDPKYQTICNRITEVACRILLVIQGIALAVGGLVITLAGHQWISSGFFDDPKRRSEAKERIVYTIIGLIIVMIAVQLVNLLFIGSVGFISCP
jgi:Na+-driven multidrug efflux pump